MATETSPAYLKGWREGYAAAERDRLDRPGDEAVDALVVKRISQLLAELRTVEQARARDARQDREAARALRT